jgi:GGDEF domain-containing protein
VTEAVGRVVRTRDRLARIGGDEFALLAADAGPEGMRRLIDALDQAIRSADTPAVNAVTALHHPRSTANRPAPCLIPRWNPDHRAHPA